MILIEFPQPAPLLSLNDRLHWTKRHQREGLWQESAWAYGLKFYNGPKPLSKGRVRITLPVKSMATRRDPHNFVPTIKPIIDGLVHARFWPDDTAEYVETTEPDFWRSDKVLIEIYFTGGH